MLAKDKLDLDEVNVIRNFQSKGDNKKILEKYKKIFKNKFEYEKIDEKDYYNFPQIKTIYFDGYFYTEKYLKCYEYFKNDYFSDEEIAELMDIPKEVLKKLIAVSYIYNKRIGLLRNVYE